MNNKKKSFLEKKAFTLLEVVITITIFMIILLFLYKTLDDTKVTNQKFEKHIYKNEDLNHLYKIIVEDIAESNGAITILKDKDKNSIILFQTNNSFNNSFYKNIAYLISSNNHLVRIESKDKFEKEKSGIAFYKSAYIDILIKDIKKFFVIKKENKYVFVLKPKKGNKIMFPTFKMEN